MEQMKRAALKIPDSVARTAIGVGKPDDVIQMLERFIKAGTNHFIIRFWGEGYFKNINIRKQGNQALLEIRIVPEVGYTYLVFYCLHYASGSRALCGPVKGSASKPKFLSDLANALENPWKV